MSNLLPSLISLDKGLNLQTAKLVAPAGSILDTLNYEQVDYQGQKRIDGFTRYDGSLLSALDDYYKLTMQASFAGVVGSILSTDRGVVGIVVGFSGTTVYMAVIDKNLVPTVGELVYHLVSGVKTSPNAVSAIVLGIISGATVDEHYNNLLTFTAALRSRVEELPGGIVGLHWFRDRLYAVADVTTISLTGITPVIYPNDVLVLGSDTAKVLDVIVKANTRIVFLSTMTSAPWAIPTTDVTRNSVSVGTIATGFEVFTALQEVASFFESRSEQQVLTEDGPSGPYNFGWRFVDLGWDVKFANGISLYGSLPSLNQNITGIGTQGPSSITGNNGRPLILTQKVIISGKPAQVSGWKSSQTPTSFDLQVDNLQLVDTTYIYGDAYLMWNGTTGEVAAPGYSTPTLSENSASSTAAITFP